VTTLTDHPVKVALPGPYLLTRTMWMECISDRAYDTREDLGPDLAEAKLAALVQARDRLRDRHPNLG
jgi:5-methyltetrahydropteroyltriglutamate--homocysteine methyltransferase